MTGRVSFIRDQRGASAAEFALVLPLLLLLLFGIIDAGRFMWEYNRAEKATQMGARYAVVTNPVAPGLASYSFAVNGGVIAGDPVPVALFGNAVCTNTSCTCTASSGSFCSGAGYDATAFSKLVARMSAMYRPIGADNVEIEYRNVGLGYAGDPNGPDVAPLVTVSLKNLQFQPITTLFFGVSLGMPDFRAALTLEDGSGNVSN